MRDARAFFWAYPKPANDSAVKHRHKTNGYHAKENEPRSAVGAGHPALRPELGAEVNFFVVLHREEQRKVEGNSEYPTCPNNILQLLHRQLAVAIRVNDGEVSLN